ncbi:MAG: hypothetical protein M3R52_01915 [Acidobacteriota bacterium]|nr:hypothetical protein [Acidobacteriota bacterium]
MYSFLVCDGPDVATQEFIYLWTSMRGELQKPAERVAAYSLGWSEAAPQDRRSIRDLARVAADSNVITIASPTTSAFENPSIAFALSHAPRAELVYFPPSWGSASLTPGFMLTPRFAG